MKQLLAFCVCLFMLLSHSLACDVCGSATGSQYTGMLPQVSNHFIGIQHQYRGFSSRHPLLFEEYTEHSQEHYHTFQVWGRYNVTPRWQLSAFVPYQYNLQQKNGSQYTTQGVGDVSLLASYRLLQPANNDETWRHTLLAGGGIKLPTGRYAGISMQDAQGAPNMQAGTGSWDVIVNANYTAQKKAIGINADAAYIITTANSYSYKYGNKLSAGTVAFYQVKKGNWQLLPQLGARYEYALHDYDNYRKKWLNEQTGGYLAFATAGLQAYYANWGMRAVYSLPVSQQYGGGYIRAQHRLEYGFFYLFN